MLLLLGVPAFYACVQNFQLLAIFSVICVIIFNVVGLRVSVLMNLHFHSGH
jgi:hypothetical protein